MGQSKDITALPQEIRDFILSSGRSLNPLSWQGTFQLPTQQHLIKYEHNHLHFFIHSDGWQIRFYEPGRKSQGIVYEIGPVELTASPHPAAPRKVLNRPKACYVDDPMPSVAGEMSACSPYFAELRYYYPDGQTTVNVSFKIVSGKQQFSGQIIGSTGQLELYNSGQVHYQLGEPVHHDDWQHSQNRLRLACDTLEAAVVLRNVEALSRRLQPLHLLNVGAIYPGDSQKMNQQLFAKTSPVTLLFEMAEKVWQQDIHRSDLFVKAFCQQLPCDKTELRELIGQSFGIQAPIMPTIAKQMHTLIYLVNQPESIAEVRALSERWHSEQAAQCTKEMLLLGLLCACEGVRPLTNKAAGNQLLYFKPFTLLGQALTIIARLQLQRDQFQSFNEVDSKTVLCTLPVPSLNDDFRYVEARNLSTPVRVLRLALFFDGTGQNREVDEKSEFAEISNPAKLHDLFREETIETAYEVVTTRRIYIPGVGTITDHEASGVTKALNEGLGLGLGVGAEGGQARIAYALKIINHSLELLEIDELVFDLFGFSRGAALARYFANLVNQWPAKYYVEEPGENDKDRGQIAFPQDKTGYVSFVGIWDTVGSFYFPGNAKEGEFNLNLNQSSAQKVVHLVAAHEIRHNFPSTRICDENKQLAANFIEEIYPGVHCDVGGGYKTPEKEPYYYADAGQDWRNFFYPVQVHRGMANDARALRLKQAEISQRGNHLLIQQRDVWELRKIQQELSIIPLLRMYELALEHGVNLRALRTNDLRYIVPKALAYQYAEWRKRGKLIEAAQYLRDYLHVSERALSPVNWYDYLFKNRNVYFNQPKQAVTPRNADETRF